MRLTNNSAYKHSWPCAILVIFTYPNLLDILRSLAGVIYQALHYWINAELIIGL